MSVTHAIINRYTKLGSGAMAHHKLLTAKAALIKSDLPHPLKLKMATGYRSAEKSMFGKVTTLPGEAELGVQGMGTTMGMRTQIKRIGMEEGSNATDSSGQDLLSSLMSRIASSGGNSQ